MLDGTERGLMGMTTDHRHALAKIKRFDQLIAYLRDEMGWPIARDSFEDVDDLFYDFTPDELGIDPKTSAKIQSIKRLRPLSPKQPWGIFFVKFEPKKLPVIALRRILNQVALKKRASADSAERAAWSADDLLFISKYGEGDERQISFAHFSTAQDRHDLPTLKVLGWDNLDTALHLDSVARELTQHLAWPLDDSDIVTWRKSWRAAFSLRHREVVTTSQQLSVRLAELARAIRARIKAALAIETEAGPLTKLMKGFQEALIHDLDADGFADMYAQTIAYGLLSARVADPEKKTADDFASHMRTNPFLRELMETFLKAGGRRGKAGGPGIDFDELGVSEVVELLDDANMEAVVLDFGDRNPQEDPVIHFYELFLQKYDAKERMQRGVFYTPRPVVSHIVRAADELLRTEFGLADGLADTATWGEVASRIKDLEIPPGISQADAFVQILDPATGTGTFLVEVVDLVHRTLVSKWKAQGCRESEVEKFWNEYVPKSLLPRLHGYELLMAPYAIAHLKMGLKLYETGYKFESDERARIYLTNALEPAQDFTEKLEFIIPALAHEAQVVNEIKKAQRFTVVIGNPPYSKMSGNLGSDAVALVEPFRYVNGERIVEKGALALELNLQDDYVKFWGLLCARILATGVGLGAYISNSRYLASPTLRGLRSYVCASFSKGIFLDLGGQVSERKSINAVDENVFDIEQGVGIGVVALRPGARRIESVRYGRITGTREEKYELLGQSRIEDLTIDVAVGAPLYRFTRAVDDSDKEFNSWPALDTIMPFNSGSIITSRDNLAIDADADVLLQKIDRFASSRKGDKSIEKEIGYSAKSKWDVEKCKKEIRTIEERRKFVRKVLYRPFDVRSIFYLPSLLDTPSKPVCDSIFGQKNLVLLTPGVKTSADFNHVLISRYPSEKKACSHDRATQMFPLYSTGGGLISTTSVNMIREMLGSRNEERVLHYIYAILHCPMYRARYGNALRDCFPRIPLPRLNDKLFDDLANRGGELVGLHLMESPKLDHLITTYTGPKNPEVARIGWSNDTVWINAATTKKRSPSDVGTIGFKGVPGAVWAFQIGGYQVCEKWLKDRKGLSLTADDIVHYQKIVVALVETIRLMTEIDEIVKAHGGFPAAFTDNVQFGAGSAVKMNEKASSSNAI
jgi:predicted helicase